MIGKLGTLCFSITRCNWILDVHTNRPQTVQTGSHTSSSLLLNTRAPQGCESPLLFRLYSHGCIARLENTSIVKIMDGTFIIVQIANNDDNLYWQKIDNLAMWSTENNSLLIVNKTKELKMGV